MSAAGSQEVLADYFSGVFAMGYMFVCQEHRCIQDCNIDVLQLNATADVWYESYHRGQLLVSDWVGIP